MRLAVCALSAILLSGCSYLGLDGSGFGGGKHQAQSQYGAQHGGHYKSQYEGRRARGHQNPCQIMAPTQPIPRGCNPSQVTYGTGASQGGFPQQPNFSSGYGSQKYASGGYGSHAANAGQQGHAGPRAPRLRKPKWRAQLGLGVERSNSGNFLNTTGTMTATGIGSYDPAAAAITYDDGGTTRTSTGVATGFDHPSVSLDDIYRNPVGISGGVEYIWNNRTTLFANVGHATADSENLTGINVVGDVNTTPDDGTGPEQDVRLAELSYDFNDLSRTSLELGGRHYFNPILGAYAKRSITPYLGAALGASHYNKMTAQVTADQLDYQRAAQSDGAILVYDEQSPAQVDLINSGWVPTGALSAGIEWQMTPKTALAFETGVRVEGGRKYANGERGDENIAIPFTIRGSYNF